MALSLSENNILLDPCFSKCGLWTSRMGNTLKFVKISNLIPDLLHQNQSSNTHRWFTCTFKFEQKEQLPSQSEGCFTGGKKSLCLSSLQESSQINYFRVQEMGLPSLLPGGNGISWGSSCHAGSLELLGESGSCDWNQRANWSHMAPNLASCEGSDKTPQGANQM